MKNIVLFVFILNFKIKNRLTFKYNLIIIKLLTQLKLLGMETKTTKRHGVEIQFSSIDPLELWKKLGLEQLQEGYDLQDPTEFADEESKRAYEAFRSDFNGEKSPSSELTIISSDKGSVFIWSLLKEESRRSPMPKLSSKKFLFKDNLFKRICKKVKEYGADFTFSKKDFEDIVLYLEDRRLVLTSTDGIRATQHFAKLFHESYDAWLVF